MGDGSGDVKSVTAKNILVAVGGWPFKPKLPGIEHTITSNEIFYLEEQPKRIVIVGGGFIALEFATIMDGLGSDVTLMYRGDLFLRGFDGDMRNHLKEEMVNNSRIDVQFNTDPKEIIKNEDGSLTVVDQDGKKVECDAVMYATGRKGKTDKLNLEALVPQERDVLPLQDHRGRGHGQGGRLPHRHGRRRRNDAGHRHRREDGRHEKGFR